MSTINLFFLIVTQRLISLYDTLGILNKTDLR